MMRSQLSGPTMRAAPAFRHPGSGGCEVAHHCAHPAASARRTAFASTIADVRAWVAQDEWGVAAQVVEPPIPEGAKPAVLAD